MQCSALVIDDEPLARKRMISLLEPYSSEIEILGEAGSGAQAIKMIHETLPDVVFLDIQMPDMDAFEVLHSLSANDVPLVIFTTAYDNFALKAFDENTVDYLLKPVDPDRLAVSIEKLRRQIPQVDDTTVPPGFSWEKLCNLVDMSALYLQRLQVKVGDRIVFVNIDEVVRFHSEEKYTTVYTVNGQYVIDTPTRKETGSEAFYACTSFAYRGNRLHRRMPQGRCRAHGYGASRQGGDAAHCQPLAGEKNQKPVDELRNYLLGHR